MVDVTMPQMGVSVAEGTVVEWKKQPGDWVQADEIIAAISTDKIDTDVESPGTGRGPAPEEASEAEVAMEAPGEAGELQGDTTAEHAGTAQRGSRAARRSGRRHYSPVGRGVAGAHA